MPRVKLLSLLTFIAIGLVSAGLLHSQELPDVFDPVLRDIGGHEGRTVLKAQLLDYTYREVLDDYNAECGAGDPFVTRYYVITALTDQLKRYTYHITVDGTHMSLCGIEIAQPTATPTVDLTRFTATPTFVPTMTETPRFGAKRCDGFLYSRLRVGEQGRVLPGEPNRLREQPDADSLQLRIIPAGQAFDVLEGPECDSDGHAWWRVRYLNTEGWTVEGGGENYYVEPIIVPWSFLTVTPVPTAYPTSPPQPTSCPNSPPPRLVVYGSGRVTLGEPNNLRRAPTSSSYVIAIIPAGATFEVWSGPVCDETGRTWWRVFYDGGYGWTVEGEGDTYYVEPVNEPEGS